jgi:hypothetical protein
MRIFVSLCGLLSLVAFCIYCGILGLAASILLPGRHSSDIVHPWADVIALVLRVLPVVIYVYAKWKSPSNVVASGWIWRACFGVVSVISSELLIAVAYAVVDVGDAFVYTPSFQNGLSAFIKRFPENTPDIWPCAAMFIFASVVGMQRHTKADDTA